MAKTQTFTKLSPSEATAEVTAALNAAGFDDLIVSSSPLVVGRQDKVFLATVASKLPEQSTDEALAILRDLPDVCTADTMGRGVVFIYRRLH